MAFYDQNQEILIEGTVARFDWVNPHMYLYIETESPAGEKVVIQGEGLGITQALVDGLDRDALEPGMPIVVRANPNRGGFGKQIRLLDVTTEDGEILPFYAANTRSRRLTPADSLEGKWAPTRASLGAAFGALARFPLTPEARAVQAEMLGDGLCYAEPTPVVGPPPRPRALACLTGLRRRSRGTVHREIGGHAGRRSPRPSLPRIRFARPVESPGRSGAPGKRGACRHSSPSSGGARFFTSPWGASRN